MRLPRIDSTQPRLWRRTRELIRSSVANVFQPIADSFDAAPIVDWFDRGYRHGLGAGGLFVGGIVGGLLLVVAVGYLSERRHWIRQTQRLWVILGGVFGFVLACMVTLSTLSSPIGPILSTLLIGAGAVFGEIALLDGKERSADATAAVDCELLVVPRRSLLPPPSLLSYPGCAVLHFFSIRPHPEERERIEVIALGRIN